MMNVEYTVIETPDGLLADIQGTILQLNNEIIGVHRDWRVLAGSEMECDVEVDDVIPDESDVLSSPVLVTPQTGGILGLVETDESVAQNMLMPQVMRSIARTIEDMGGEATIENREIVDADGKTAATINGKVQGDYVGFALLLNVEPPEEGEMFDGICTTRGEGGFDVDADVVDVLDKILTDLRIRGVDMVSMDDSDVDEIVDRFEQ